jgi:hypothetical protein
VSDDELVPCCIWEYARESALIRGAVTKVKAAIANQGIPHRRSSKQNQFNSEAETAFGLLLQTGFDVLFWTSLPFPEPWQHINDTERAKWSGTAAKDSTLKFPPFQLASDLCDAGEMYEQAKRRHVRRLEIYQQLKAIDDDIADPAQRDELRNQLSATFGPLIVTTPGCMTSIVGQINWRDYTDAQIKEAFCRWVDKNRPQGVGRATLKGKKKETRQRVMLDRLALMRLLHCATRTEIEEHFPSAWERYKNHDWYRARVCARDDFHGLFPFLPTDEIPQTWVTSAGTN